MVTTKKVQPQDYIHLGYQELRDPEIRDAAMRDRAPVTSVYYVQEGNKRRWITLEMVQQETPVFAEVIKDHTETPSN